jgi:hypothetical protein
MHIVTATATTQGKRGNDFNFCIEANWCCRWSSSAARTATKPGRAGAAAVGRGPVPTACGRTTTAMVRDLPLTVADYTEAVRSSLEYGDWLARVRR